MRKFTSTLIWSGGQEEVEILERMAGRRSRKQAAPWTAAAENAEAGVDCVF